MSWNPDYTAEINRRTRLLLKAKSDKKIRKGLMTYYKSNPVDWINDFCITFDPRNDGLTKPRLMPFMLFPRQEEFVQFVWECFRDKENGLIEKCRDVGASWVCCAISVWLFIFHEGTVIGWGSNKEEGVDKIGNPKAIFTKIRQIFEYLPQWMLPKGFILSKHAPFMRIVSPSTDSAITGESGDNIGRGGRTSIFFKDESAHYERPELIEASLGDNTDVQIDISSVNGSANVFYRRRMAGEVWEKGKKIKSGVTRVFIFDWRDHPLKSDEWYEKRRDKAEREGLLHVFKQEVDRDYSGSQHGIIIPQEWVKSAIDAHIKLGIKIEGKRIGAQDVADDGGDKNALILRHGILTFYANAWAGEAGDSAEVAIPICVENKINELYYDNIGVGTAFTTQIKNMRARGNFPEHIAIEKWDAGSTPEDPDDHIIPWDESTPTNRDQYANLKAQAWFRVRAMFKKTHMAVTQGEEFDPEEIISLCSKMPMLHQLCLELSQARVKPNDVGKTVVDKKPKGSTSPNLADGLVMCYNPIRKLTSFDII